MTKQETFDKVCSALIAQGRQAFNPNEGCRYRGVGGAKCAAGHLIPDEYYTESMEDASVMRENWVPNGTNKDAACLLIRSILRREGHDLDLVADLQGAHDRVAYSDFVRSFRDRAREIAYNHDLLAAVLG